MTVGAHGVLALQATESNAPNQTPGSGATSGGKVLLETDVSGQSGHPFLVEGALVTSTSSSKYGDEIHSHALTSSGSLQIGSGTLKLYNEEAGISTGSIAVAAGATLLQERSGNFTNEGPVNNSGTTILTGYNSKNKWIQGSKGSIGGNPVVIESGGGLEESSSSGAGSFTMGAGGAAYLLGTVPKGQTITLADATGQTSLYLGNSTLVNEGTLHIDLPAGDESNTNIEEGSIVNKGTNYGTVEGTKAIDVIDTALTNEPGAVLAADSGTLFSNREITNNGLIEIAPGATFEPVATKLVNGAGGTIAPQISGANTFGKVNLGFRGELEAGGTLAPTLTGGFTPSANEEFDVIEGSPVRGTFATVSGGFSGDYTHESSEPPYVGVVYGPGAGTTGKPGTAGPTGTTPINTKESTPLSPAKVIGTSSSDGRVTVKLACPADADACGAITVKVTVTERLKKHGRTTTKTVVVASGTVSLKAGTKATLKLHIDSAGRALLRKHHSLRALATVTQGASKVTSQKVTLKG